MCVKHTMCRFLVRRTAYYTSLHQMFYCAKQHMLLRKVTAGLAALVMVLWKFFLHA